MYNIPVENCIKNVYKPWKQQGETRGNLSPASHKHEKILIQPGYIHSFIPTLSALFHPHYTQPFLALSPPFIPQLYTLSTAPTIKRTKEK